MRTESEWAGLLFPEELNVSICQISLNLCGRTRTWRWMTQIIAWFITSDVFFFYGDIRKFRDNKSFCIFGFYCEQKHTNRKEKTRDDSRDVTSPLFMTVNDSPLMFRLCGNYSQPTKKYTQGSVLPIWFLSFRQTSVISVTVSRWVLGLGGGGSVGLN